MAAEDAVLRAARGPATTSCSPNDAYGGTFRLVVEGARADGRRRGASPTSPTSTRSTPRWPDARRSCGSRRRPTRRSAIVDIAAVAAVAHEHGARVVVDNTFATPYLQRPLELGADVVVHSTTKYLGGHSDVVGGFVAANDAELGERIAFLQNAVGAVPSPFDCYLVLRGIKTLGVRMDRHCANAQAVADDARRRIRRSTRALPGPARRIPATTSRRARCATSAGW